MSHPLAGAGAGIIAGKLYVFGGIRAPDAPVAEKALWQLDLSQAAPKWRQLEDLPGRGKVLPIVTAQYEVLHIIGGRDVVANTAEARQFAASADVYVYRPVPLEGTTHRGWQRRTSLPVAMAGGVAVPSGQAHTLVLGGDSTPMVGNPFTLATPATPQTVRLYHALTDAWADTGCTVAATGPGTARTPEGELVIFGGLGSGGTMQLRTVRRVRSLAAVDYGVIAAYFAIVAGIGMYFSRRQESTAEFSLGSRSVLWWAAGISMFATGASAISFMAVPALAFSTNLVWLLPVVMVVPAYFIQSRVIFPLLRRLDISSTYEYLERRFNLPLRLLASFQQILFLTFGRAAVVLVLPALAISTTTGVNVYASVVITGILTTIYTAVGGFKAVIWTEVFQGILKFAAPVAMIGICLKGLPGGLREFVAVSERYHKFDVALLTWDLAVPALWIMLIVTLFQFTLMQAGDQPMIQRIFSAPENEVRRVAGTMAICAILIAVVVNVMGIAIFAYFHAHPTQLDATAQNDQIVPLFVSQALPGGLAGLVIAAICASAMATVASGMNSVATIFTEDFYRRWRPAATDRRRLQVMRMASFLVGILGTATALLLAGQKLKSMMAVWMQISALLGGGIVGVYSLGMFTKRANGVGAVCGALISVATTVLVKWCTPWHWQFYLPIAIASCVVSGYAISLIWPEPKRDLTGLTIFTPRRGAEGAIQGSATSNPRPESSVYT